MKELFYFKRLCKYSIPLELVALMLYNGVKLNVVECNLNSTKFLSILNLPKLYCL